MEIVDYKRVNAPIDDWPSLITMDEEFFYIINEFETEQYKVKKKQYEELQEKMKSTNGPSQDKSLEQWKKELNELT